MKAIKNIIGLLILAVLFTFPLAMLAQATNDVGTNHSAFGDITHDTIPTSKEDFWKWGIGLVVPAIVLGMKKLIPRIPKWALPMSTPLIGLALGFGLKELAHVNLGWVDMTQAGALAVFIRETFHQMTKANDVGIGSPSSSA